MKYVAIDKRGIKMKTISKGYDYERKARVVDIVDVTSDEMAIIVLGLKSRIKELSELKREMVKHDLEDKSVNLDKSIKETETILEKLELWDKQKKGGGITRMNIESLCKEVHESDDKVKTGVFTYIYCRLKLQKSDITLKEFIKGLKELTREELKLWITDVINRINKRKRPAEIA